MDENGKIIFDLDNINTRELDDINGLLQREAYEKIVNVLNDKVEYLKHLSDEDKKEIDKCRVHNSIFVDGKRGSGKTYFLVNIEKFLNSDEGRLKSFIKSKNELLEKIKEFLKDYQNEYSEDIEFLKDIDKFLKDNIDKLKEFFKNHELFENTEKFFKKNEDKLQKIFENNRCLENIKKMFNSNENIPEEFFKDDKCSEKIKEFLKNIKQFLENEENKLNVEFSKKADDFIKKTKYIKSKLYFFKPIDPTLLYDNESFLTIIIATILNDLELHRKLEKLDDDGHCGKKQAFYEKLSKLAEAIDGVISNKNENKSALEVISQDQSSVKLMCYAHQFFKEVSEILGDRVLVLLIDDIDMAFDKGFEILDTIRKYLASPFLIPIITGNLIQYKIIVSNHFLEKDTIKNKDKDLDFYREPLLIGSKKFDGKKNFLNKLTIDYLIKIFERQNLTQIKNLIDFVEYYRDEKSGEVKQYLDTLKGLENIFVQFKENSKTLELSIIECRDNFIRNFKNTYRDFFNDEDYEKIFDKNKFTINFLNIKIRSLIQVLKGELKWFSKDKLKLKKGINPIKELIEMEDKYDVIFLGGNEYDSYKKMGDKFLEQNNFKEARDNYEKAKKIFNTPEINNSIANSYLKEAEYNVNSGNFKEARDNYEKAIEKNSNYELAYINLATILANQFEEYQKAKEYYEYALKLNSNNELTYVKLAYLLNKQYGKYQKAKEYYERAIELNPKYALAYNNLGDLLENQFKNYEKAKEYYERAIELNPKYALAYNNLGDLLVNQFEDYQKAKVYYEKAIEINPNYELAYNNLGNLFENQFKDYEKAKECYENAIEVNPNYELAYINLAYLLENQFEEYEKAKECYEKVIEINPKTDKAYTHLESLLEKLIDINYQKDSYWFNLIDLYYMISDENLKDIIYDFLKIRQSTVNSLNNLKLQEKIETLLNKHEDINQIKSAKDYYREANITYNNENYREAIKLYEKAIELNPEIHQNDYKLYFNLGYSYDDIGEYTNAKEALEKSLNLNPNYEYTYNLLADVLTRDNFKDKDYKRAINLYKKAIDLNPKNNTYKQNLEKLKEKLNAQK